MKLCELGVKEKLDLIKKCNKLFNEKQEEQEELQEQKIFLDKNSVCGIIPKKQWVKTALLNNFDVGERDKPTLDYNYNGDNKEEEIKAKYSTEFLKIVLEMTKHYDELTLKMKKDYPLTICCEDFDFVLAPRVDDTNHEDTDDEDIDYTEETKECRFCKKTDETEQLREFTDENNENYYCCSECYQKSNNWGKRVMGDAKMYKLQ